MYWDANIFYPVQGTLAFSETLLPLALLLLPVSLLGGAVTAYNVALIASFAVGGWGCFALAHHYLGSTREPGPGHDSAAVAAAFTGAALFVFSPYRVDQLAHIQVMWLGWLPLSLWAAERYLQQPRPRWLWTAGLAGCALALTNTYFALFGGMFLGVFVALRGMPLLIGALRRRRIPARHAGHAAVLLVVVALALGWVGSAYRDAQRSHQIEREPEVVRELSARPGDLLKASHLLRHWESLRVFPHRDPERRLFPGLLTPALAVIGVLAALGGRLRATEGRPPFRPLAVPFGVLTVVALAASLYRAAGHRELNLGFLQISMRNIQRPLVALAIGVVCWVATSPRLRATLSRGVRGLTGPRFWLGSGMALMGLIAIGPLSTEHEWWVVELVPLAAGLRAPARAFAIVALCASLFAAHGAFSLLRRLSRPGALALAAALCVAGMAESWSVPWQINRPIWEYPEIDFDALMAGGTDLERRLAALPPGTPLMELPVGEGQLALVYMFRSTDHWQPLVNGFTGFIPPAYERLRSTFRSFPDAASLSLLRRLGVRWVVVHPELWPDADLPRLRRRLARSPTLRVVGRWRRGLLIEIDREPANDVGPDPTIPIGGVSEK